LTETLTAEITAPGKAPIRVTLRGKIAAAVRGLAAAEGIPLGDAVRKLLYEGYRIVTGHDLGGRK